MRLVKSPGLLTALSAECYIKYKAMSLEDEFYRTFVNNKKNKDVSRNVNIKNDHHVQPAALDLMSKYLKLISSIPKKNSAFCLKTSYFMNK